MKSPLGEECDMMDFPNWESIETLWYNSDMICSHKRHFVHDNTEPLHYMEKKCYGNTEPLQCMENTTLVFNMYVVK